MNNDYLVLFLDYLAARNRSERTIDQYQKELQRFFAFAAEKGITKIQDIELLHLDMYQSQLMKKNKTGTVNTKMAALRSFYTYLHSRKYISDNPMQHLEGVKIKDADRKRRDTLTIKEARRLIVKTEENSHPAFALRNQVLVISFLYFGLRVSELCDLKTEEVSIKNKTVYIYDGKGGKHREVPIGNDLIPLIRQYLKNKPAKTDYFFTAKNTGEPLKPRGVLKLIHHHRKKANIKKNIGCHSLRRTAATLLLESGVDIRKIQIFLGHASINTTMLYLNFDIEETKKEIRDKHILGKELRKMQKTVK